MTPPSEIKLPDQLHRLVKHCEKICDSGCCGRDAFDFSPLHVASYLSTSFGISEDDIAGWELELQKAEDLLVGLSPNKQGYICSVDGMNQYFRRAEFEAFLAELRHSIRASPQVVEFANRLRYGA